MIKDILLFIPKLILNILKNHKLKIFVFSCSLSLFFLILAPYGDLSDLISTTISKETRGQVHVQFEDMGLGILPTPSVKLNQAKVALKSGLRLKAESFKVTPSLISLISESIMSGFKPRPENLATGSLSATGLLGGEIDLDVSTGKKINENSKQKFKKLELEFENISLGELNNVVKLPVSLFGKAQGKIFDAEIDPSFSQQPSADVEMKIKNLKIPASTVESQMGPLSLPALSFKSVSLKGRLVNQEVVIEEALLGQSSDGLNARIKGKIALSVLNRRGRVFADPGRYDLKVQMNVSKKIGQEIAIAFILFEKFKKPTSRGHQYTFRTKGRKLGADTPSFLPISSF